MYLKFQGMSNFSIPAKMSITFQALSDFLIQNKDVNELFEFVKAKLAPNNNSFELYRQQIIQFIKNHNFRWIKKCKGRKELFHKNYGTWLQNEFTLNNPSKNGKRLKPFEECSDRTKRRRMDEVRQNRNPAEIKGAYMAIVRNENVVDAEIINNLSKVDLETKNHILKVIRGEVLPVKKFTVNEALALMVDLKLSKPKYEQLRSQNKDRNADLLPPYYRVVEAKAECYPPKEFITLSELGAEVELQQLLNHTIDRLIQTCDRNLSQEPKLQATYKWGMDGASGQSLYKQIFNNNSDNCSDASVFMISLLPLQIESTDTIIWTNPLPSSTKLCRPIKFKFMKETPENSIKEYESMEAKIRKLNDSVIVRDGNNIHVSHKLYSTMVDGKMVDDLSGNKCHSSCNICSATTSEMNNFDKLKMKELNESNYAFGISSLHCWIRFMECVLHISYKLDTQKWAAYTDADKEKVKAKKLLVQAAFKRDKGKTLTHFSGWEVTMANPAPPFIIRISFASYFPVIRSLFAFH